ncbi:RNA polymerase sigma factor [Spirillospora sp. NBC_00431]
MPADPEPTDAEVWRRAVDGDGEGFGVLFDRHSRAVYNHCFRRVGDWSAAEELTSVVFLEAWRRRAQVRLDGDSALPWLLGVAANVTRNRNRALRRQRAALARIPVHPDACDHADAVAERLDAERAMAGLLRLVRRLSRDDQDVLALCAGDGLSYAQAALALGVPVGTVRSRLSRARSRLRDLARAEPRALLSGERAMALNPAEEEL